MLTYLTKEIPDTDIVKVLWPFLHISVICFVLISGFFGIHSGMKGFAKLVSIFLIYSIPNIVYKCTLATTPHEYLQAFMFISKSEYWFIRTYLALFLLAPLINRYNESSSDLEQFFLLSVFGILSIYIGCIAKDPKYVDGKNIINFLFLYQLGSTFRRHESLIREKWGLKSLIFAFAAVSVLETLVLFFTHGSYVGHLVWRVTYPYSSPCLIANASLLFLIFTRITFSSSWVNTLAKGCLAVYLIHEMMPIVLLLERPLVREIYVQLGRLSLTVMALFVLSILVMSICLLINYLLTPFFDALSRWEESQFEKKRLDN